jgi:hypothetical protein
MSMSAKKTILVATGLLIAGSTGVTWHQVAQELATETALAAVAQQRTAAEAKLQREADRLAAAEKTCAAQRAAYETAQKAKDAAQAAEEAQTTAADSKSQNFMERLLKDPEMQNLQLASNRIDLANTYAPLFSRLNLTPEQIEKFQDNALARMAHNADSGAAMRTQGLSQDDPVLEKLSEQAEAEYQQSQRALLGEAGYRQFQEYERTADVRDVVRGLAGAAAVEGLPFSAQQAEQLTQLLANTCSSYRSGKDAGLDEIDWAAVDAQARTILSESQLKLIQTVEPDGPYGNGSRFLHQMNRLIDAARKTDVVTKASGG